MLASKPWALSLKAVRKMILDSGASRKYINDLTQIVKQIFRWGVSEELVPETVYRALLTVDGLRQVRTKAREPAPIGPVDDAVVDATLPYLPPVVADMVRFQRLSGARPGEVCRLRPMDLDRGGEIWTYRPASHKTQHHGKSRIIFVGPHAQAVLLPYLDRPADTYCFDPRESVRKKIEAQRAKRKTRIQPSQRNRRKANPKRVPGGFYRTNAYLWAIKRAVDKANKKILEDAEHFGIDNPALIPHTAVIFDMDGVLVDSEPIINAAAIRALAEFGIQARPADFEPFVGAGEDRYVGGVAELYDKAYTPKMKHRTYDWYLKLLPEMGRAFPGAKNLVELLQQHGIASAVASSADRIKVEANLETDSWSSAASLRGPRYRRGCRPAEAACRHLS